MVRCDGPAFQNPNGVPSNSPGLRAPRYPGKWFHRMIYPNGVVSSCFDPTPVDHPILLPVLALVKR